MLKLLQDTQQGQYPSSKAKEAGVPIGEILKTEFYSKNRFYQKRINAEDSHFQLSILKGFEERSSKQ